MKSEEYVCRGCLGRNLSPIGEKDGFTLLRCADCKTAIATPLPSEKDLIDFYQNHKKSECYKGKKESKLTRSIGRVKRILSVGAPGKTFLDIGCNVGYMVAAARGMGLDATGIDIDGAAIANARENFRQGEKFELISLQDLAARGDRFDIAYTSEVVEHVRDPESFIAAAATVLKPGGLLYITCPDGAHFGVPKDFAAWGMVCPPEHLTFFSRAGMKKLLARHGLEVEKFQLAFKPGMKALARKAA
jgi:2-polyprenyl-6-hydroxyphenyl methylase/3-demethylubiquinone-9 3-methyltransferase